MTGVDTAYDLFLYYSNILFLFAGCRVIMGLGELFERWLRRKDEQHARILNLQPERLSDEELLVLSGEVGREGRRRGWRSYEYDESETEDEEEEEYDSDGDTAVDGSRLSSPDIARRIAP